MEREFEVSGFSSFNSLERLEGRGRREGRRGAIYGVWSMVDVLCCIVYGLWFMVQSFWVMIWVSGFMGEDFGLRVYGLGFVG